MTKWISTVKYYTLDRLLEFIRREMYYSKRPLKKKIVNFDFQRAAKGQIDIIIVAFNNEKIIKILIDKLEKYFKDPYQLIIADNSSIENKSKLIYDLCTRYKVSYFRLPKQSFYKLSSSHGVALNWIYKNIIKKRKPDYFGFIDHDLFPISDVTIIPYINAQNIYGLKHYGVDNFATNKRNDVWEKNESGYWYFWPGFSFFKFAYIRSIKKVNFLPCVKRKVLLDTGGSNFESIYSQCKEDELKFPDHTFVPTREGRMIELIDNKWVHTLNGSNWRNLNWEDKAVENILEAFENTDRNEE